MLTPAHPQLAAELVCSELVDYPVERVYFEQRRILQRLALAILCC